MFLPPALGQIIKEMQENGPQAEMLRKRGGFNIDKGGLNIDAAHIQAERLLAATGTKPDQTTQKNDPAKIAEQAKALGLINDDSVKWLTHDPKTRTDAYVAVRDRRVEELKLIMDAIEKKLLPMPELDDPKRQAVLDGYRTMPPKQLLALKVELDASLNKQGIDEKEITLKKPMLDSIASLQKDGVISSELAKELSAKPSSELGKLLGENKFAENARSIHAAFKKLNSSDFAEYQQAVTQMDPVEAEAIKLLAGPCAGKPQEAFKSAFEKSFPATHVPPSPDIAEVRSVVEKALS